MLLHSGQNRKTLEEIGKKVLGQCAGIMQTVLHLTPLPSYRCQAPVQNRKMRNQRCSPKPKETLRNRGKKTDSGTMCWYHVKQSVGQIFFFRFLEGSCGLGQNLSISRFLFFFFFKKFWIVSFEFSMLFRFWTPSFDFSIGNTTPVRQRDPQTTAPSPLGPMTETATIPLHALNSNFIMKSLGNLDGAVPFIAVEPVALLSN